MKKALLIFFLFISNFSMAQDAVVLSGILLVVCCPVKPWY